MLGSRPNRKHLNQACEFYLARLEMQFKDIWPHLLRPVLAGTNDASPEPTQQDLSIIYKFMTLTARKLINRRRKELALSNILDKLDNKRMLKEGSRRSGLADQVVFIAISWLTFLYDAEMRPAEKLFQLVNPLDLEGQPMWTRVIKSFDRPFDDQDQPLLRFIQRFGHDIVPRFKGDVYQEALFTTAAPADYIAVSYVCYHALSRVANVRIEWVNSLSQHLEFDRSEKSLKLFRFPSFCMLMHRKGDTFLSR